jgi:hypothetical protein
MVGPFVVLLAGLFVGVAGLGAQEETRRFGDLAEGPYDRLVIRNVMVIPGHGGPPTGPHDILIEGDRIAEMRSFDAVAAEAAVRRGETVERWTGDRVIEGDGMYVMPGIIDLHTHVRQDPLPMEWFYYLKLAHGVTTVSPYADRGWAHSLEQGRLSDSNQILAPRWYHNWDWGWGTEHDRAFLEDPANAARIAQEMWELVHRDGGELSNLMVSLHARGWSQELVGAIATGMTEAGGTTTFHMPPSTNAVTDAVDAARLGVTFLEHHYAFAESALPRRVQDFPRDYDYDNENHRFRGAGQVWVEAGTNPESRARLLNEVADSLVHYGAVLLPTRVVYEANRDILRAMSLPWHEKYTHQALIGWSLPNASYHGSYHYDWTSDDEYYWTYAFDLWSELIYEVNRRGGRVAYGTDDNYIWATPGFSNVRELQLLRETGMHNLEVLKAATYTGARTARLPGLGLVRPGYVADLVLVDGNPAFNLRFLYSFGALRLDEAGEMVRTRGIVHTIKDGIVIENSHLMREVERMVAESKEGVARFNAMTGPFVPGR